MALVSEVLEHIGRIYSPLNLANMKIQKFKFVRNTAPDNQRVLNFTHNPYWRIFLFWVICDSQYWHFLNMAVFSVVTIAAVYILGFRVRLYLQSLYLVVNLPMYFSAELHVEHVTAYRLSSHPPSGVIIWVLLILALHEGRLWRHPPNGMEELKSLIFFKTDNLRKALSQIN